MRRLFILGSVLVSTPLAGPALAMDRYGQIVTRGGVAVADPDARIERLAAASTPAAGSHGKPAKSARNILRDDPYLRGAFAWLDNK